VKKGDKVYLAYAVTNGHPGRRCMCDLAHWLREHRYKVTEPSACLLPEILVDGAIAALDEANILIADISAYSHGVGFEIGYAYARDKKVIVTCSAGEYEKTSQFILGLFSDIIIYENGDALVLEVSKRLRNRNRKSQHTHQSSLASGQGKISGCQERLL